MSEHHDALLAMFMEATGEDDPDVAKSHLERNDWDVDSAVESFVSSTTTKSSAPPHSASDAPQPASMEDSILGKAKKMEALPENSRGQGYQVFGGRGKRLDGTSDEAKASSAETKTIRITFWKEGFTVDDGPLRHDKEFLKQVEEGYCPQELVQVVNGKQVPVSIQLQDKRGEEYVPPPKPKYVAFSGAGRALSSATASTSNSAGGDGGDGNEGGGIVGAAFGAFNRFVWSPVSAFAGSFLGSTPEEATGNEQQAHSGHERCKSTRRGAWLVVDPNRPVTTIRVRLCDGRVENCVANTSHTVAQLTSHLEALAEPDGPTTLVTGFPPKPIENDQLTISEAGLEGASVIQSLRPQG